MSQYLLSVHHDPADDARMAENDRALELVGNDAERRFLEERRASLG